MKVYMRVSTRDQLDVGTQNLRALNFAHVKLHVVTPPQPEIFACARNSSESQFESGTNAPTICQESAVAEIGDVQLCLDEFIDELNKVHADLVVIPFDICRDELLKLIEKTPCSILINRSHVDGGLSIKSVLATDHTLYSNLAIEKFRSFRPSGFSGATVISTDVAGETSSGVAETRSMRIPDVEAARLSDATNEPKPLLDAICQQCLSRGSNLLMIATHSLRSGLPGTLGGLLPQIIDNVDASILILKAY